MSIHPAAFVHSGAQLSEDVEIGPGVCIEGPAVLGPGCVIQAHAILTGAVRLGRNNRIGYGAVLGAPAQDLGSPPETASELVVGDNNTIREYCTLHKGALEGTVTRVGDGNYLMAGAHVGHNATIGSNTILANNVLLAGHVQVGDGAFLGGGSVFHQHIRVGRRVIARGNSAYTMDIPPFMIGAGLNGVAGPNVIGMRREGLDAAQRQEIKDAFKLLYRSGLNIRQALARAQEREWGEYGRAFFDFVATAGKRGICSLFDKRPQGKGAIDVE